MATTSESVRASGAKSRSPVERVIVWGLIVGLLVLVGIEASSKMSHQRAMAMLEAKMKAIDDGDGAEIKLAQVKEIVGGKDPVRSEDLSGKNIANNARRMDVYTWFSLNPYNERAIYVYYGIPDAKRDGNAGPDMIAAMAVPEQTIQEKFPPPSAEELEAARKNAPAMPAAPGGMGGGGAVGPAAGGLLPGMRPPQLGGDKKDGEPAEGKAPESGKDDDGAAPGAEEKPAEEKPADENPTEESSEKPGE